MVYYMPNFKFMQLKLNIYLNLKIKIDNYWNNTIIYKIILFIF